MRVSCGLWSRVKGAFGRFGQGIKKGWNWVKEKVPQAVKWARDKVPKVIDTAKKVLNVLPQNKYTDKAKQIVNKSDEGWRTINKKGEEVYNKGKEIHGIIKGGLANSAPNG